MSEYKQPDDRVWLIVAICAAILVIATAMAVFSYRADWR